MNKHEALLRIKIADSAAQGRVERVYNTLKGETLQHWLTIAIIRENGSAHVETRSTLHVNRSNPVPFSWGHEFTDAQILNDKALLRKVYERYGRDIFTAQYTREFN
nr:MAG: hypothetical protein [Bacteriophage sp.]